jgi:hypothetical protein
MSPYYLTQRSHAMLPVLTCFVPSLLPGCAFKVSVHSWERPRSSRTLESLMQPDDAITYEVRVFIDGACMAYGWLPCSNCVCSQLTLSQKRLADPTDHLASARRWVAVSVFVNSDFID